MDILKDFLNMMADPRVFFTLSAALLAIIVWKRELLAENWVGYGSLALLGVFFLWGAFDENFQLIIGKPDNVPIVGLIFLLVFFVWYSMREAVLNDRRIAKGEPPIEKQEENRVWVWPDLVYTELIAIVVCSIVLIVWSIVLEAPLEQPANAAATPNPSKAPWYFLGLQEMLVYFDPWLAGVVLPSLIVVGLMAIPYIDANPKGNGYYTFNERRVEITLFLFGFGVLWIALIVLGTFLRGPNWNFFGPFEFWDIHKLEALTNVDLSEYFWVRMLGTSLPNFWLVRELPGLLLVVGYIGVLPLVLAEDSVQEILRSPGSDTVPGDVLFVPDDDGAADQDAAAVALQSEVHRPYFGVLLQYLSGDGFRPWSERRWSLRDPWLTRNRSGTPSASTFST